jgi:PAS domain S-box-containing protein
MTGAWEALLPRSSKHHIGSVDPEPDKPRSWEENVFEPAAVPPWDRLRDQFRSQIKFGGFHSLLKFLIFELAFLLAYAYGMSVSAQTGAPFWLPDSVLVTGLLLSQPRSWPIYVCGTLPLRFVVAVPPHAPLWFLFAAFANDSVKGVLAAAILRRVLHGRNIYFDSLRDFWLYLLATATVAPAISAIGGAATWVARGHEFWPAWRNWYFGDALANVVLTPLLLYIARDWRKLLRARWSTYLEALAISVGLAFAVEFARQQNYRAPGFDHVYEYLPVPFLLMAAVRFGSPGAAASFAILSFLSIAAINANESYLSDEARLLSTQLFLMVLGVPIMSLAVLVEQQRRTECALRESETRFRKMVDSAPAMIWISDCRKGASFFNRSWLHFTGRRMDQEVSFGWVGGVHPDYREAALEGYSSAFDDRRVWEAESQLRRADGEYRWMLCRGAPRYTVEGVFEGYTVSASDITELKTTQQTALARQKLESLGVLAGGIAHDFNNLLGSIHANAELAETSMTDGSPPREEIQTIRAISMRASGIVNQLMLYAGNRDPEVEPLDLSALVGEMLGLITISISKSAVLKTAFDKELPAVLGNRAQIQQVLMNLVLNASDSLSAQGGDITVTTSVGSPSGNAMFASLADPRVCNYVVLAVSDTGSGISKDNQSRILDPFFTTKMAGRGLGLALVQGVVHAHKGSIELTSAPGQGTTFRVLWPIADQSVQSSVPGTLTTKRQFDFKKDVRWNVLLVEDEELLRVAIAKMLRKEGFHVVEAADGTAAVGLINDLKNDIDLVVLDMTIPGEPSRRVAMEVGRSRPKTGLLLMSAYSREMVGDIADAPLVKGFVRKPFQICDLVALIGKALAFQEDAGEG